MSKKMRARRLAAQLSARDLAVLGSLQEFRLMTGAQLRRLHFGSGQVATQARKARASLKRLTEIEVVVRLARRIGGNHAGSEGYVYGLGGWGHAVLDADQVEQRRHRRVIETRPAFLDHILAVGDVAVALDEYQRAGRCQIDELRAEPGAWRQFTGDDRQQRTLKPDGFIRVTVGEYELSSFVEMDMSTESVPTIARKLGVYVDYWRAGQEQQRHGVFPRVWWLVPDQVRHAAIARTIERLPAGARGLFSVALQSGAVDQLLRPPVDEMTV
ncbi:replication-relaxation family protein [Amycolatopsis sp. H20-H5]|uniref:replication-relaxation family protein n=1 Tax=Amycolatopsis sp. H20-H5 TaxID=3046309 RepID=UPI002DB8515A|nr:replication-relaxation family protein [Amycolatopsis sp. H20-H5]MEC3979534.1 replication-relaxation family protein [Amycolatopsis sp. H20-H5]